MGQEQHQEQRQEQQKEEQQDSRRTSRNYEHGYEQPQRRESVMSPSRRVSNQVWPEERAAGHHPSHQSYSPAQAPRTTHWDDDGYIENRQTEHSRRYNTSYEASSYSHQREVTP